MALQAAETMASIEALGTVEVWEDEAKPETAVVKANTRKIVHPHERCLLGVPPWEELGL